MLRAISISFFFFFSFSLACMINTIHISVVQVGLWSWDLEELSIEDIWVFIHVLMHIKSVLSKAARQLFSKKVW